MHVVLSRSQMQAFDAIAAQMAKVPGLVLMENAGRGAAEVLQRRYGSVGDPVVVVVGPGNNGGDGYVLARHLMTKGRQVTVIAVQNPPHPDSDAACMRAAWLGCGGTVRSVESEPDKAAAEAELASARIVVDALFGTGLTRPISGPLAGWIDRINRCSGLRVALDLPSGLDADTGRSHGCAVRAHLTCTFGHLKLGLLTPSAADHTGAIEVVGLGVPAELCQQTGHAAERFDGYDVAAWLGPRPAAMHKGVAGRVAVMGGAAGTSGASLLVARAALRAGAGLVYLVGTAETVARLEPRVLEAMTRTLSTEPLEESLQALIETMDVAVIGPGLGNDAISERMVLWLAENAPIPVVLDADALTCLSRRASWPLKTSAPRVLLPHAGELARLLDSTPDEVESDRCLAVQRAVELTGAVVALKGAYTWVGHPGHRPLIVGGPCPVLATGGSGDVLAGAVGALLVGLDAVKATVAAVHLHHQAAVLWQTGHGSDRGMLASELADGLVGALAELSPGNRPLTD